MKPAMRPWGLLSTLVLLAGCYSYSEPPPPRSTEPIANRDRTMAASGLDMAYAGPGRMQRSNTSGTNSDVDDDDAKALQLGMPELAYVEGLGGPGFGDTRPQADLDAPNELVNGQARGVVFRPSDHYFVNGMDTGPSVDAMPGTGGLAKLRMLKKAGARELKAAELMEPRPAEPVKPPSK
jgi:hypothetical protein